jgi:hypothetical protein
MGAVQCSAAATDHQYARPRRAGEEINDQQKREASPSQAPSQEGCNHDTVACIGFRQLNPIRPLLFVAILRRSGHFCITRVKGYDLGRTRLAAG